MSKKYYWLKLKDDFFEDDTIQYIEEQENGKEYVLIYLKLCLKALKEDGVLVRYVGNKLMPYDEKVIAKLTNSNVDTVRVAVSLFAQLGLIEKLENGELYLSQLNELVGVETEHAVIKRKQRLRAKRTMSIGCPLNVHTEKEKEKEKETEKELEKDKKVYMNLSFIHEDVTRIKLTQENYDKLIADYGDKVNQTIENMNDWLLANGKTYKNYYSALKQWLKRDSEKTQTQTKQTKDFGFYLKEEF